MRAVEMRAHLYTALRQKCGSHRKQTRVSRVADIGISAIRKFLELLRYFDSGARRKYPKYFFTGPDFAIHRISTEIGRKLRFSLKCPSCPSLYAYARVTFMMRYQSKKIVIAINLIALGAATVSFLLIRSAIAQTATISPPEVTEVGAATSTPIAVIAADPAPSSLREVRIIGTKYTDYFTDGSKLVELPGDPNIHANIAKANAPVPTREGLTWDHSVGTHLYDTQSGDLEIGTFALQPNGTYIAYVATTTIENATSTPFLPARIVILQERPVPAAALSTQSQKSSTAVIDQLPSATTSITSEVASPGNEGSSSVEVNNAGNATTSDTNPSAIPPAQEESGQVLGTSTEQYQSLEGNAAEAASASTDDKQPTL